MEFVNLARGVEIGANSYLIRGRNRSLILDAGMHPKKEGMEATPDFSLVPDGSVSAILVTHGHQDHVGMLPELTRRHPKAKIFMTRATARIADVMLHNSVNVMIKQKEEGAGEPLFTHRAVELSRETWQPCNYHHRFDFTGERLDDKDGDGFKFVPAGHILGAAGVFLRMEGVRILFTGDVNFENQTLIRGANFPEEGVDVLIMETTRGDNPALPGFSRVKEEERLARAINEVFARGASVAIPVFALGKTQELLGMVWRMRMRGDLPPNPLYVGGLSTKLTKIYDQLLGDEQRLHPELNLLQELAPYVLAGNEVAGATVRKRCLYAISSGMMTENTVSNIFARKVISDPNQALFFIGYSDPDSPAGKIRAASHGDLIELSAGQPPIPLLCEVKEFSFSAHASRESLLNYAVALKPRKILLVHGGRAAVEWFHMQLYRELPETEIIIPEPGRKISLK